MRALLFDPNVVAAKRIGNMIELHAKDAQVDYAPNTAVLQHRLANNHYDLVLADIDTTLDVEGAAELLRAVKEPTHVFLLSQFDRVDWLKNVKKSIAGAHIIHKPATPQEVESMAAVAAH